MCLIVFDWQPEADVRLRVAANRDEFHSRPTAPLSRWTGPAGLYAGRDLKSGGTWLGVTTAGRFAAVTNVRAADAQAETPRSRGWLVSGFLDSDLSLEDYARQLWKARRDYSGFNLILADRDECLYLSNFHQQVRVVSPGIHSLSNAQLDTPWPKTTAASQAMEAAGQPEGGSIILWDMLNNPSIAPDAALPETGVPLDWERRLSACFIVGENYGTRASTMVSVGSESIGIEERRFGPNGTSAGRTRAHIDTV